MNTSRVKKLQLPILVTIVGLLMAGIGAGAWYLRPQQAMSEADVALQGNQRVQVNEETINGANSFLFRPEEPKNAALIFYPGARVPARAYAPGILEIAREGYSCFLIKMPINLAVLGWQKAEKIISAHPEVDCWAIAGHSMGGAMAARFAERGNSSVDGLILWASYPPKEAGFGESEIQALSITATNDQIIDQAKILRSRDQLPPSAEFVSIDGGNHSQFGWYGFQEGDGRATISRKEQMQIVVSETTEFLVTLCRNSHR